MMCHAHTHGLLFGFGRYTSMSSTQMQLLTEKLLSFVAPVSPGPILSSVAPVSPGPILSFVAPVSPGPIISQLNTDC